MFRSATRPTTLWLCFMLVLPAACAAADTIEDHPNIILILADDLGWSDLGCYGADLHETPHLDRLAAESMRFKQAYAAAPVCTPTRAAILTGKHPARLHMTTWREAMLHPTTDRRLLPPDCRPDLSHAELTLAEALAEAGYLTAHVGKWHLGESSHYPETHGFDVHVGGNHWGAPATHFFPYRGRGPGEIRYVPGIPFGQPGEYLADRLTDEAITIVRRAGKRPFFLNLWHYGVHTPLEAKAVEIEHFQAKLQRNLRHQHPVYAAMVKNLDDNVGRLLACLDELGLTQNTIVLFSSDNGGYVNPSRQPPEIAVTSNAPLRSGKGSLYEGGIRVPLLVRWPGHVPAGSTCDAPVTSADFRRTLLELAAVAMVNDQAQQADGLSLVPLLKDPKSQLVRDTLYWHFPHYYPTTTPASAIRQAEWKLIEYHEGPRLELYNLREDPGELRDSASTHADMAKQLHHQLKQWRRDVDAQMPTVNAAGKPSPRSE